MYVSSCFPHCLYQENWSKPSGPTLPASTCFEKPVGSGWESLMRHFITMVLITCQRPFNLEPHFPLIPQESIRVRLCDDSNDCFCWGRTHRCGFSHLCNLGGGAEHFFFNGSPVIGSSAAELAQPSRHGILVRYMSTTGVAKALFHHYYLLILKTAA